MSTVLLLAALFCCLLSAFLASPLSIVIALWGVVFAVMSRTADARNQHAEEMAAIEDLAGFLRIVAQNSYREPPAS